MPYDDHVRSLLTSRSARTGPLASFYSPTHTADTLSMQSPHPRESPSLSNWSESPSCYSQSRMSVDDSASETSTTSEYYGQEVHRDSELYMSSVLQRHHGSSAALSSTGDSSEVSTVYRDSYVDPLRDSSEDERTEGAIASGSNDTLSDTGALRPVESDTSVSTGLSTDPSPDPRLSFLGPKTRLISKAPWEEDDTIQEEALSETETQTDTLSIFAGKLKVKGRSRSKTVTSEKAGKERRFLGGGWGRSSTDTRPSMDSFKRSMDVPLSPRSGSFPDQLKATARTPSLFSTSSGASSGPSGTLSGPRPGLGAKLSSGLSINSFSMDSRATSPAPSGSPTASSFVHPYANLELLPPGQEAGAAPPSRSDSNTTLTASTSVSPHMTPSSSSSSSTSPGHDETFASAKREKRRPPQISVSPLNRSFGGIGTSIKSPTAMSTNFSLVSPTLQTSPANDDTPAGMLGFPGSPACNLISLEQAQMKARERSKSVASDTAHASPLRKELKPKKSKPTFAGIGGGFSSTIGVASPSPVWAPEDGRARTVSAGSALHGRSKGYTTSNLAAQSTTSVNIIQGGGIENIPEAAVSKSSGLSGSTTDSVGSSGAASADTTPSRTLKPKRSGFLKFFKDMASSNFNSGNLNISAPSTPIHVSHTSMEPLPPVPPVPVQFQSKSSTLPDEGLARDKAPPPVVVSSPDPRSLERSQSLSDDSHTSIGDHAGVPTSRDKYSRSNTDPVKRLDVAGAQAELFGGLRLRPVSSAFNGLPDDYLVSSPQVGSGARGSSEAKRSDDYGFEEANIFSPATPSFPVSARSRYTHGSSVSSGSDAFSSLVDPRTPSSLGGFPPGVPRTSTDSQSSAAIIALLREQLRAVRQASKIRVNELESQVQELKSELEKARCEQCGRRVSEERRSTDTGIVNRPRARTGGGSRTIFGAQQ